MGRILKYNKIKIFSPDSAFLAILSAFILVVFAFIYPQNSYSHEENTVISEIILTSTIVLCFSFAFYKYKNGNLSTDTIILLLFICGFAFRLFYVIKHPYYANQHDVESLKSSGHLKYIYNVSQGELLPKTNDWQFSHPPLHHLLAGFIVDITKNLGGSTQSGFENVQLLTCFYSTLFMTVGYKILILCGVSRKIIVYCSALLAFSPIFSILAGSINNDTLSILLFMLAFYYLLKWNSLPCYKYAIISGIFAGLGMMTKFSVAVICVVSAITVLIKNIFSKKLKFKNLLGQSISYLSFALPLGLWFQIRNMILFNQPLGYVAPISTDSALFIGDISIIKRLFLPFSSEQTGVYVDVWNEHNLWHYLSRNSLFGEYNFGNEGIARIVVIANIILILLVIVAFIYLLIFVKNEKGTITPLSVLLIIQMLFFIYFNIKYPFGCSMDFRYIVPILFVAVFLLGIAGSKLENRNGVISRGFIFIAKISICVLCAGSIIVFL